MKGTVKFFNTEKGFGFIAGEDGKEYFVHHSAISGGTLRDNDAVTFEPTQGDRGPKATNVAQDTGETAPAATAEEPADDADAAEEMPEDDGEDDAAEEADTADDDASGDETADEESAAEELAEEPADETMDEESAEDDDSEEKTE